MSDQSLTLTEEEDHLRHTLAPLVRCDEGHLLATVSALLLSLVGKTDCAISGVLGAGKTRAAAATIAGLITANPSPAHHCSDKGEWHHKLFAEHVLVGTALDW